MRLRMTIVSYHQSGQFEKYERGLRIFRGFPDLPAQMYDTVTTPWDGAKR